MRTQVGLAVVLLALPARGEAATRVTSDSACPSSDAIGARLLGMLSSGGPEAASARVRNDGSSLHIEVSAPGETDQQRTVPLAGDCDQRAEMAALIIASWLGAMPVHDIKAPGIPPRPRPPGAVQRSSDYDPSDDPLWDPTRTSGRALLGAGGFGMVDSQGGDGGLVVLTGMPALIEDFGAFFEASLGWARELAVGQGRARYWRPTFTLQGSAQVHTDPWLVRLLVGPALAVLAVSGSGYDHDTSATTVTWGIDFGLALVRAWRKQEVWLSCATAAWPQSRRIRSLPTSPTSDVALPGLEVRVAAGFSWGIRD